MIIAVSLAHLPFTTLTSAITDLYVESLKRIAGAEAEHEFIFITGTSGVNYQKYSKNISVIASQPKADNRLFWKFWLDYTLPAILKNCRADILINTSPACSLRTKVPQCLIITGLFFLNEADFYTKKKYHFFNALTGTFLQRSSAIIAGSDYLKNKMEELYEIDEKKIEVIYPSPVNRYQPIDWHERERVKTTHADGKEYFLYTGEIRLRNNLILLLKAFSLFKIRQKSNMQMILAVTDTSENSIFFNDLKTYKYRDDVKVIVELTGEKMIKLTGAAYAFVYPFADEFFPTAALLALECEVPVIMGSCNIAREILDDAALFINPGSPEDIANKMMLLFKDETKRNELIDKGKIRAQHFGREKADDLLRRFVLNQLAVAKTR